MKEALNNLTERQEEIFSLVKAEFSYAEIGRKLGISRQRVHQIYKNYGSNTGYKLIPVTELKITNKRKREHFGVIGDVLYGSSGRNYTREIVRMRDKHTCQDCKKEWIKGQRRFDVHHLNGLCGKKSKSIDKIEEIDGLITLCHKCHFNRPEHKTRTKEFSLNVSLGHKRRRLTKL